MRLRLWLCVLLALCLIATAAAEDEEASPYVENNWDFVDGSMDVSGGIPGDVMGELGRIRDAGVLRVATEPYFAPQEFIDPALEGQAQYVGADMELAKLIAQRMGVALEIVPMDFFDVLTAVAEGQCNLAISALSYTPARAGMVELSKGYHFTEDNLGNSLLIRAEDAAEITDVKSLADKNIVAQSGSLQEAIGANNIEAYHEFRRLASIQAVYAALTSGKADAAIVDIENTLVYLENNPDCGLALVPGVTFTQEPQFQGDRIAGKKGELQLMYFVNGVIDEVLSDGRYEQWFREYGEYAARLGL